MGKRLGRARRRTNRDRKTVPMAGSVIDLKLELGQAHAIDSGVPVSLGPDNPAIAALSEQQRTIWDLSRRKFSHREIARIMGFQDPGKEPRGDLVNRILAGIREKITWLWRLRSILMDDPRMLDRFLGGKHCTRACPEPGKGCPAAGKCSATMGQDRGPSRPPRKKPAEKPSLAKQLFLRLEEFLEPPNVQGAPPSQKRPVRGRG